ncbi:oxygen-independent coproporphyrinogen III oxidase [Oligoflexia bacterium]|nr:oxygen-independent coproporphyrinogen III oxidase [Oligoflexia bacterium]
MNRSELFKKYDVPAPRYTSYPTVPYWSTTPTKEEWLQSVQDTLMEDETTWSMYIHIPFCESFCTYCACNTSTTKDHSKEAEYIAALHQEWNIYASNFSLLSEKPLRQIHIGGGSPSFLSAENMRVMLTPILELANISHDAFDASVEVDPRTTTEDQLKVLHDLGFSRISIGVQDFNEEVQRLVNRVQPREITERVAQMARAIGYYSVNFDLIYGLPKQTPEAMRHTVETTVALKPDRIALYSLAIVPWIKPAHRKFKDSDLPTGEAKRKLYEIAVDMLLEAGYVEIGMDHFALPHDTLNTARQAGKLHRNFMGYTENRTDLLLALGASSISESKSCYHQNEKVLPVYLRRLANGELPTHRGHLLTDEDKVQKQRILSLMTRGEILFDDRSAITRCSDLLEPLINDGVITIDGTHLKVTEAGKPFLRNVAMALDFRLRDDKPETKVFSQAV